MEVLHYIYWSDGKPNRKQKTGGRTKKNASDTTSVPPALIHLDGVKTCAKIKTFSDMGKKGRYESTIRRAENIRKLTQMYYEPGNLARCYKSVWRRYIYPIYPMCYKTYLNYLGIPTSEQSQQTRQLSFLDLLT